MLAQFSGTLSDWVKKNGLYQPQSIDKFQRWIADSLKEAESHEASVVVFPELSVPIEAVDQISEWSKRTAGIVIAGTQYYRDAGGHISRCPIVINGEIFYTEKTVPSPLERSPIKGQGLQRGKEIAVITNSTIGNFAVLICSDYLDPITAEAALQYDIDFLFVVAFHRKSDDYHQRMSMHCKNSYKGVYLCYVNCSCEQYADGQSAVFGVLDKLYMPELIKEGHTDGKPAHKLCYLSDGLGHMVVKLDINHKRVSYPHTTNTEPNFELQFHEPKPKSEKPAPTEPRSIAFLPRRNPFFVGRDSVLIQLSNEFAKTTKTGLPTIQILSALGGVGKTQIAIEYVYRNTDRYSHVFWISASDDETIQTQVAEIVYQLELAVRGNSDQPKSIQLALQWLKASSDWLVILDNADDPKVVAPFLVDNPQGHYLITSRARNFDAIGVSSPIYLQGMHSDEGRTFAVRRTGRNQVSDLESTAIDNLVQELGGLPLALEQACAYIISKEVPFAAYLVSYHAKKLQLLESAPPVAGGYPSTVATTWSLNIEAVEDDSPCAAEILRYGAFLHPDFIPLELFAFAADCFDGAITRFFAGFTFPQDMHRLFEAVEPLTRFSLIELNSEEGALSVHRLVQEVIKSRIGATEMQIRRRSLVRALARTFPVVTYDMWYGCQRLIHSSVALLSELNRDSELTEEAGLLFHRSAHYLEEIGNDHLSANLYLRAVEIRQSILKAPHPELGMSVNNLGMVLFKMGEYHHSREHLLRALAIREECQHAEKQCDIAQTLNNLGITLGHLGLFAEAENCFDRAEEIYQQAPEDYREAYALCLNNRSCLLQEMGKLEQAVDLSRQSLAIRIKTFGESDPRIVTTMSNLATLLTDLNQLDEALEHAERAVEIRRHTIGERHPDFARSLNALGGVQGRMGLQSKAKANYAAARDIFVDRFGWNHPSVEIALNNLAMCEAEGGDHRAAIMLFDQLFAINRIRKAEPDTLLATAMHNCAICHFRQGQARKAIALWTDALEIRRKILGKSHHQTAIVFGSLATAYSVVGDTVTADKIYVDAIDAFEDLRFPDTNDCNGILEQYSTFLDKQGRADELEQLKSHVRLHRGNDRRSDLSEDP